MPTGIRDETRRPAERLPLDADAREVLQKWARAATSPQRLARRSRIVLLAAEGCPPREIARRAGTSPQTVRLWISRFRREGVAALDHDAPGRGRKPTISAELARAVVALRRTPPDGQAGPTSVRRIARELGLSPASVHRLLKREGPATSAD